MNRFYLSGIKRAVDDYCRYYYNWQKVVPKAHYRTSEYLSHYWNPLWMHCNGSSKIGKGISVHPSGPGLRHLLSGSYTSANRGPQRHSTWVSLFTKVKTPQKILTDQGTPFMSGIMRDLCKLLKMKKLHTSVYHPLTDGLVESFNKRLKQMLHKIIDQNGNNWDQLLPYLMLSIREVPQASSGFSPFELLYGRPPEAFSTLPKKPGTNSHHHIARS